MVQKTKEPDANQNKLASQLITKRIAELGDWRGEMLAHVRKLIREADPEIVEELKWVKPSNPGGVPVWSHNGLICTGETYNDHLKFTFAKGASIKDPEGVFTQMGTQRRAMDLFEGDAINESAFKEIIRTAVKLNSKGKK